MFADECLLVSLPCRNLAKHGIVIKCCLHLCICAGLPLQEQFLSSELLQLVEKCRMSHGGSLPDIKLVPGMVSFFILLSYNDLIC